MWKDHIDVQCKEGYHVNIPDDYILLLHESLRRFKSNASIPVLLGSLGRLIYQHIHVYTLPETNLAPKNEWLEYDRFLLGPGLFSGANLLLVLGSVYWSVFIPTDFHLLRGNPSCLLVYMLFFLVLLLFRPHKIYGTSRQGHLLLKLAKNRITPFSHRHFPTWSRIWGRIFDKNGVNCCNPKTPKDVRQCSFCLG